MLPLSGKKEYMLEKFIKYAHHLTGVVRYDNVDDAWVFVCSLYGILEKDIRNIDDAGIVFL